MHKNSPDTTPRERRAEAERTKLRNYRAEIKLVGQPLYQFRVRDVSTQGAGILIKDDSDFISMIEVGQIINVNFISPKGTAPSGIHKTQIKHITAPDKAGIKGHRMVGVSILEKIDQTEL